ncbi:MAG TPA: hypothetical protein VGZ47_00835 [Gemmataceae bacterium]|jgi:C4-dicarboxylate-specific signal transduction histidine kinase|nr:hypothetical protein [Gemmataceae bacterium]
MLRISADRKEKSELGEVVMRTLSFGAVLGLAILGAFGCNKSADESPSPLRGKLEAALEIRDPIVRDDALFKVAQEAAAAGDLALTKKAVREMGDPIKKDDAAAASAFKLAEKGQNSEATEVAKLINDPIKRDATLAKIAKG